jgi:hypothetical protein
MHTHLVGLVAGFPGPGQLTLYLQQGVTTIRSYYGSAEQLSWRQQVATGDLDGPTILQAGPVLIGIFDPMMHMRFWTSVVLSPLLIGLGAWFAIRLILRRSGRNTAWKKLRRFMLPSLFALALLGYLAVRLNVFETPSPVPYGKFPRNAAQARESVREEAAQGFDFVKVYDWLPAEAYLAAIDEANRRGIYVVGHLLDELSVETTFAAGLREAAHVDEFMEEHMIGEASPRGGFSEVSFDYGIIPQTVESARQYGVAVVSNLVTDMVVAETLAHPESELAQPEYDIVPPATMTSWLSQGRYIDWAGQEGWRSSTQLPFLEALTRALHNGGVPLLTGTDVGVEGMVPSHIHRELEILVEIGLSPYEALQAATTNAGMVVDRMGRDGSFGEVSVGRRADLVLLRENPLSNISSTRNRVGVMARGQWFTQDEIDRMVEDYVATY